MELKIDYPDKKEYKERQIYWKFIIKTGEKIDKTIYKKWWYTFSWYFRKKNIKVSNEEDTINPLYCVSLPGYTRQCGLK